TAARLAWTVWGVSLTGALAFAVLELWRGQVPPATVHDAWENSQQALGTVAFGTVGAIVASRRNANALGWIFLGIAVSFAISAVAGGLSDTFPFRSTPWQWGIWGNAWSWVFGWFAMVTFVLLLFPDGHLPSRRWRWAGWLAGVSVVLGTLGGIVNPSAGGTVGFQSPFLTLPESITENFALPVSTLIGGVAAIASIVALVMRFRRSSGEEREQMKWFVYAGVATVVLTPGRAVAFTNVPIISALGFLSIPVLPVAVGIAVLKYRLYDIDVVINKTLVFGALAAFITAVYVAIVVGIGELIGAGTSQPNLGLSILATAVVAVAFQPVRSRVQRFANRLVYGERATPYEVLSEFSSRMAGTYASEDLLPRMARILAEGTGAREATVWLNVGGRLRAGASWPAEALPHGEHPLADGRLPDLASTVAIPVEHRGDLLGALSLSKAAGERLTPAEEHLARDLASGAGLVLRNVRLTEELLLRLDEIQASRQRIVAAQDGERRRLERNIHDGAQQQLVALAVKVRLARQLADRDAEKANELLEQAERETGQALDDLRNLARGIYPPLLADQGLVAALSSQVRRSPIPVTVEADRVGRYSQDAEAAVYFCALEALQNVAKYAGASTATVRLAENEGILRFTVTDDGAGFDTSRASYGTGLQGMADRLSALDGELQVRSAPGQGTTVEGRLPVAALEPVG
ncbi:MAG TPA: histidine kinase, partial [Actinomycetota bacterium]|nr:histidine kinase [Actinomycetota bacterium]